MRNLIEIVTYEKKVESHFVGVKILQGSLPESGMIYKEPITNTRWQVSEAVVGVLHQQPGCKEVTWSFKV